MKLFNRERLILSIALSLLSGLGYASTNKYFFRVPVTGLAPSSGAVVAPPAGAPKAYANWVVFSDGNLSSADGFSVTDAWDYSSPAWKSALANVGKPSGKWYWEVPAGITAGVATAVSPTGTWAGPYAYVYSGSYYSAAGTITERTFNRSAVTGIAADLDNGTLTFYVNGCQPISPSLYLPKGSKTWYPITSYDVQGYQTVTTNFGQKPFTCTPPAGYNAGWYQ